MSSRYLSQHEKARLLADSGRIVRSGDAWLVPSSTSDAIYQVRHDGEKPTCTCQHFQYRGETCSHILAAATVAKREAVGV